MLHCVLPCSLRLKIRRLRTGLLSLAGLPRSFLSEEILCIPLGCARGGAFSTPEGLSGSEELGTLVVLEHFCVSADPAFAQWLATHCLASRVEPRQQFGDYLKSVERSQRGLDKRSKNFDTSNGAEILIADSAVLCLEASFILEHSLVQA
jgi:hypothetical protein